MNVKEMIEKRNSLFEQADEILDKVKKENRAMATKEENSKLQSIQREIEGLNTSIEASETQQGKKMEDRSMDKKQLEAERRGYEQFLRHKSGEERAQYVNTAEENAGVIPVSIADQIIEQVESISNVFQQAQKFNSAAGELRVPRDSSRDQAGFVGENEEIPSLRAKFDYAKLTQRRVGGAITLTKQLINDTSFDIVGFSVNKLARQVGLAVEKAALKGQSENDQFEGILSPKTLELEDLEKVTIPAAVTYDDLINIYNSIQPYFLDGSQWIMSRALFNEIVKLEDGNGHKYVQGGVVNGRLQQLLLGLPVVVSDQLTKEDGIIFGKVSDAYGIMVKDGFELQYVTGDTQQATNGTELLVFDGYMDGTVINPQAIVVAQPGA